jgi:hypothetical protein
VKPSSLPPVAKNASSSSEPSGAPQPAERPTAKKATTATRAVARSIPRSFMRCVLPARALRANQIDTEPALFPPLEKSPLAPRRFHEVVDPQCFTMKHSNVTRSFEQALCLVLYAANLFANK